MYLTTMDRAQVSHAPPRRSNARLRFTLVCLCLALVATGIPAARPATSIAHPSAAPNAQPAAPGQLPVLEHGGLFGPVVSDGKVPLVALHSRVFALDIKRGFDAAPIAQSRPLGWPIQGMALQEGRLVAAGPEIALLDASTGPDIALLDRMSLRQPSDSVAWIGPELWAAQNPGGLLRVAVTDDGALRSLGHWRPPGAAPGSAYDRVLRVERMSERRAALLLQESTSSRGFRHVVIVDLPLGEEPVVRSTGNLGRTSELLGAGSDRVFVQDGWNEVSQIPVDAAGVLGAGSTLLAPNATMYTDLALHGRTVHLAANDGSVVRVSLDDLGTSTLEYPGAAVVADWRIAMAGEHALVAGDVGLFWAAEGACSTLGPDLGAERYQQISPAPGGLWALSGLAELRRIELVGAPDDLRVRETTSKWSANFPCGGYGCLASSGNRVHLGRRGEVLHLELDGDDALRESSRWSTPDDTDPAVLSAAGSRVAGFTNRGGMLMVQTLDAAGGQIHTATRQVPGGLLANALLDDARLWWMEASATSRALHVDIVTDSDTLQERSPPIRMPPRASGPDVIHRGLVVLHNVTNLLIIDGRDPTSPRPLSELDMPGTITNVTALGDYMWVHWIGAPGDGGIRRVDISDPRTPVDEAVVRLDGSTGRLTSSAGYVWLRSQAIQAYDAAAPTPLPPPSTTPTVRPSPTHTSAPPAATTPATPWPTKPPSPTRTPTDDPPHTLLFLPRTYIKRAIP